MTLPNGANGETRFDPRDRVVSLHDTPTPLQSGEFSGPDAADLAGISYRQLDYWARRAWVVPSRVSSAGAPRRVYTLADVVRLAALGHLGRSRVDVATYAEATGQLCIPESLGFVIVWSIRDSTVQLAAAKDLRHVISEPGRYVVFDPGPLLRALGRRCAEPRAERPRRRTFTADYKLAVLAQYERLTAPGAKGALLRQEGLHTSHLVAWRRGREAGALRKRARPQARPASTDRPPPEPVDRRGTRFTGGIARPTSFTQPA